MLAFQVKRPATVEPQSVLGFFKKQKSCRITVEGAFFFMKWPHGVRANITRMVKEMCGTQGT